MCLNEINAPHHPSSRIRCQPLEKLTKKVYYNKNGVEDHIYNVNVNKKVVKREVSKINRENKLKNHWKSKKETNKNEIQINMDQNQKDKSKGPEEKKKEHFFDIY